MKAYQLKILIVEDNLSFAIELEMMLAELEYQLVGSVDNSNAAIEAIHIHQPDLIIMDIHIKGALSGVDLGQHIKPLNIPILYMTSSKDETLYQTALQSNIIGFLIKPIEKITLQSTIELAIRKANRPINKNGVISKNEALLLSENTQDYFISDHSFFFKKKGTFHKINFENITFIKSLDNYCEVHTLSAKVFILRITMKKIQELLAHHFFIRVHRQYIVHTNHIDSLNFNKNILKIQEAEIPISRSRRKELEAALKDKFSTH